VHDNALCAVDFDAKLCKIRRVALPVDDVANDIANKQYVEQSMQILKNRQNKIDSKLGSFQSNADILQITCNKAYKLSKVN